MTVLQHTTTDVDAQSEQIFKAYYKAVDMGLIEPPRDFEFLPLAESEMVAFDALIASRCRAKLKKLGITFPTRELFQDRLVVEGNGPWTVKNLSKGTEYTVTAQGFRLDCSCDEFRTGYCKHRDAVDSYRELSKPMLQWIDDSDPNASMLEVMGWTAEEIRTGKLDPEREARDLEKDRRWATIENFLCDLDRFYEMEVVSGDNYRRQRDAAIAYADGALDDWVGRVILDEEIQSAQNIETDTLANVLQFPIREYSFPFPEGFTPNSDQHQALQKLGAWFDTDERFFRLVGPGGSGKTTIIQSFVKYAKQHKPNLRIAVAAPYNKATRVIETMLDKWGIEGIRAHTVAQLFGIRPQIVGGKEIFQTVDDAPRHYENYDLIVIDEISTVNSELWGYILDASHDLAFPTRFILMGDWAQLPPVKEGESLAFSHDCQESELFKVERYGGAIGELAATIRGNMGMTSFPAVATHRTDDGGLFSLSRKEWQYQMIQAFTSERGRQDPMSYKVLAYTNNRVNILNTIIRNALGLRDPWVVGERVVALSPFYAEMQTILNTSDECVVLGVSEGSVNGWDAYLLSLDNGHQVWVPRDKIQYQTQIKEYEKSCSWGKYWGLKKTFADLSYGYAMTVHRAQGSTYRGVFVDSHNFTTKRFYRRADGTLVRERNQLYYVAITRPTTLLLLAQ